MEDSLQSLANKIFSINLILEEICLNLDNQDLLTMSRVNRKCWHASRKILHNFKLSPIYLSTNPCVALASINKLLQSSTIAFSNGIEVVPEFPRRNRTDWIYFPYDFYCCDENCLSNSSTDDESFREMFSNILKKIEFKVFRFQGVVTRGCPFGKLIKIILSEKAHELVELELRGEFFSLADFNIELSQKVWLTSLWNFLNIPDNRKMNWFPKLKKYAGHCLHRVDCEVAQSSPNLAEISHEIPRTMFNDEMIDFPIDFPKLLKSKHFTITKIDTYLAADLPLNDMEHLASEVKPKLVKFGINQKLDTVDNLLRFEKCLMDLGHIVQFTLQDFQCHIFSLAFMANSAEMPAFPALKKLSLVKDRAYDDQFDLLKSVDFKNKFPNLEFVIFTCVGRPPHYLKYGRSYIVRTDGASLSVKNLKLDWPENENILTELSTIFPNVTTLTVPIQRQKILRIPVENFINPSFLLRENAEWPLIECLNLLSIPTSIRCGQTNLDSWFTGNNCFQEFCDEGSKSTTDDVRSSNNQHPYSFFNRKNLKSVSVSLRCTKEKCCILRQKEEDKSLIVSNEVAKLICEKLPGLIMEVRIVSTSLCNCSDHEEFDFNHLIPYARVLAAWKEYIFRDGTGPKNWRVEFKDFASCEPN